MYILLGILSVIVIVAVGVLLYALSKPKDFVIRRSISTSASAKVIYEVIHDLKRFPEWSPWQKLDPEMRVTYAGDDMEVGSKYSWSGNNDVGEGSMTIMKLEPNKAVEIKLEFLKPWEATNKCAWRIEEQGGTREIVWEMEGSNDNIIMRVMMLFMDMEKQVGGSFEEGLSSLKVIVEQE